MLSLGPPVGVPLLAQPKSIISENNI